MARVTEEALDAVERRRLRAAFPTSGRELVRVGHTAPLIAVVLIAVGGGVLAAPDPLPLAGKVLAVAAVAVGGFVARGRGAAPNDPSREAALARREAELNRVLVTLAVRNGDVVAELARRGVERAPAEQPVAPRDAPPPQRRGGLVAVGGGESLELDADQDGPIG